jgi:hypothetical protein
MKARFGTLVVMAVLVAGFGDIAVAQTGAADAWLTAWRDSGFYYSRGSQTYQTNDHYVAREAHELGEINEHIKYDYQKAINYYRLAVQLAPDNREYRESLERFRRVCPLCK